MEGRVLQDKDGVLAGLVAAAHQRYETYQTPPEVVERLIEWWRVIGPKQRDRLAKGDDLQMGLTAAFHSEIFETLYAVNNRPLPPGTLWLDRLGDLSRPDGFNGLLRWWPTYGSPRERLRAKIELLDALLRMLEAMRDGVPGGGRQLTGQGT